MLVIYDTVSDIPDIIIIQVIEFVSITSLHLTCVPFLSVVAIKLKLVVSPELLTLTRAAINSVLLLTTSPELTVAMRVLSDGGEYQAAWPPVIVQVSAPCVCGHTPWLQSRLVTVASMFTVRLSNKYYILTHLWLVIKDKSTLYHTFSFWLDG